MEDYLSLVGDETMPPPGGRGHSHISYYVHIGYVPFLRTPVSAVDFRSRAYIS